MSAKRCVFSVSPTCQAQSPHFVRPQATTTWDQERILGCVCDSGWAVGLGDGEIQATEYFGADCSRRASPLSLSLQTPFASPGILTRLWLVSAGHCPTGDDPETDVDETNCQSVAAPGSQAVGAAGNRCYVECSNRGVCNYKTGVCKCFLGYAGFACQSRDVLSSA
jgi:hypothetical protein